MTWLYVIYAVMGGLLIAMICGQKSLGREGHTSIKTKRVGVEKFLFDGTIVVGLCCIALTLILLRLG